MTSGSQRRACRFQLLDTRRLAVCSDYVSDQTRMPSLIVFNPHRHFANVRVRPEDCLHFAKLDTMSAQLHLPSRRPT